MVQTRKRRSYTTLLTTTSQDVYTTPARFEADVTTIFVTNLTAASAQVTLRMYNALGATTFDLMKNVIIPANGILQISDPLYMQVNDKLQALANANDTINVTITVSEASTGGM